MSLSEKRKELLKHTRDALEAGAIEADDIFEQVQKQDKEFIKDLVVRGLKNTLYPKYIMLTRKDLVELAGPELAGSGK